MNKNLIAFLRLDRAVGWNVCLIDHEFWNVCARGGGKSSESENGQPLEDQHCSELTLSFRSSNKQTQCSPFCNCGNTSVTVRQNIQLPDVADQTPIAGHPRTQQKQSPTLRRVGHGKCQPSARPWKQEKPRSRLSAVAFPKDLPNEAHARQSCSPEQVSYSCQDE